MIKSSTSEGTKTVKRPLSPKGEDSSTREEVGLAAAVQPSRKRTLIVPAVAVGNVGQLAVELLSRNSTKYERIDHQGFLTHCIGRVARPKPRITTPLELHELNSSLSCLQIRSMVVAGKSRDLAKAILKLSEEKGFDTILVLGGASAFALINDDQISRTRSFPRLYGDSTDIEGILPLEHDVKDLKLTGLLRYFVEEAKFSSISISSLLLYVFEGDNTLDGQRLAGAAAQYLGLI